MPGGTAGNNDEALGTQQLLFIIDDGGEHHVVGIYIDTTTHTVGQTVWLLENLF